MGKIVSNQIDMCWWYGYDLAKRKPTCEKGYRANLKCHSRNDCPEYISTTEMHRKLSGRIWVKSTPSEQVEP